MSQTQVWNEIVRIQPRGVITIPARFRDKDFSEDSFIRVRKLVGRLVLEPVTMPRYSVRRYTDSEVEEFLKLDKDESAV